MYFLESRSEHSPGTLAADWMMKQLMRINDVVFAFPSILLAFDLYQSVYQAV